MKCPECASRMEQGLIIMTAPPIYEWFCAKCNVLWDVTGNNVRECHASPRKKER